MTLIRDSFLQVANVYFDAKFHQAKCSGSWVIVYVNREKDDAENNTALASAGSNYSLPSVEM